MAFSETTVALFCALMGLDFFSWDQVGLISERTILVILVPKKPAMIKWVVAFSAILLPPLATGLYVYQGHLWDEISE